MPLLKRIDRRVLVLALVGYGLFMAWRASAAPGGDFHGWYVAAERLAAGERVYFPQLAVGDEMPNKHGLIFLVLFRPLTWLPQRAAQAVWVVLSVLMLAHVLALLARLLAGRGALGGQAPWVGLALVAPFVHTLLKYEQTGLFLLWLIVIGLLALARGRDVGGGLVLGLAAAIKLMPAVFLPWLLFKKRFRAALGFVLALAASVAVPAAIHGVARTRAHLHDYVRMLRADAAKDSHHYFHQSLRPLVLATIAPRYFEGTFADEATQKAARAWQGKRNFLASPRLFAVREWIVLGLSLGFVLLCAWAIVFGAARSPPAVAGEAGLVLAAMILISPLAWKHYYVWLLPAAAWCWAHARDPRSRAALVAFAVLLTLPHKGLLGSSLAHTYRVFHGFAFGLAVFVVLYAFALRRSSRRA